MLFSPVSAMFRACLNAVIKSATYRRSENDIEIFWSPSWLGVAHASEHRGREQ